MIVAQPEGSHAQEQYEPQTDSHLGRLLRAAHVSEQLGQIQSEIIKRSLYTWPEVVLARPVSTDLKILVTAVAVSNRSGHLATSAIAIDHSNDNFGDGSATHARGLVPPVDLDVRCCRQRSLNQRLCAWSTAVRFDDLRGGESGLSRSTDCIHQSRPEDRTSRKISEAYIARWRLCQHLRPCNGSINEERHGWPGRRVSQQS